MTHPSKALIPLSASRNAPRVPHTGKKTWKALFASLIAVGAMAPVARAGDAAHSAAYPVGRNLYAAASAQDASVKEDPFLSMLFASPSAPAAQQPGTPTATSRQDADAHPSGEAQADADEETAQDAAKEATKEDVKKTPKRGKNVAPLTPPVEGPFANQTAPRMPDAPQPEDPAQDDPIPLTLTTRRTSVDRDIPMERDGATSIRLTRTMPRGIQVTPKVAAQDTAPAKGKTGGKRAAKEGVKKGAKGATLIHLPNLPAVPAMITPAGARAALNAEKPLPRVRGPVGWSNHNNPNVILAARKLERSDDADASAALWWNNPYIKGDARANWTHHDRTVPTGPLPQAMSVSAFLADLPGLDDTETRAEWSESVRGMITSRENRPTVLSGYLRQVRFFEGTWGTSVLLWIGDAPTTPAFYCVMAEVHAERLLPALNRTTLAEAAMRGDRVTVHGIPRFDTETPFRAGVQKASPWTLSPSFSAILDGPHGAFAMTTDNSVRDRAWANLHAKIPGSH